MGSIPITTKKKFSKIQMIFSLLYVTHKCNLQWYKSCSSFHFSFRSFSNQLCLTPEVKSKSSRQKLNHSINLHVTKICPLCIFETFCSDGKRLRGSGWSKFSCYFNKRSQLKIICKVKCIYVKIYMNASRKTVVFVMLFNCMDFL